MNRVINAVCVVLFAVVIAVSPVGAALIMEWNFDNATPLNASTAVGVSAATTVYGTTAAVSGGVGAPNPNGTGVEPPLQNNAMRVPDTHVPTTANGLTTAATYPQIFGGSGQTFGSGTFVAVVRPSAIYPSVRQWWFDMGDAGLPQSLYFYLPDGLGNKPALLGGGRSTENDFSMLTPAISWNTNDWYFIAASWQSSSGYADAGLTNGLADGKLTIYIRDLRNGLTGVIDPLGNAIIATNNNAMRVWYDYAGAYGRGAFGNQIEIGRRTLTADYTAAGDYALLQFYNNYMDTSALTELFSDQILAPEPSAIMLLGVGAVAIFGYRKQLRKLNKREKIMKKTMAAMLTIVCVFTLVGGPAQAALIMEWNFDNATPQNASTAVGVSAATTLIGTTTVVPGGVGTPNASGGVVPALQFKALSVPNAAWTNGGMDTAASYAQVFGGANTSFASGTVAFVMRPSTISAGIRQYLFNTDSPGVPQNISLLTQNGSGSSKPLTLSGGRFGGAPGENDFALDTPTINWDVNDWYFIAASWQSSSGVDVTAPNNNSSFFGLPDGKVSVYVHSLRDGQTGNYTQGGAALASTNNSTMRLFYPVNRPSSFGAALNIGRRSNFDTTASGDYAFIQFYNSYMDTTALATLFNQEFLVPEPSTVALLMVGGLAAFGYRKRRKAAVKTLLALVTVIGLGTLAITPAQATLTFYAPYDSSTSLTVGSPSVPTATTGTVSLVPGFPAYGVTGNAGSFGITSNALAYGNVSSYFSGATPSSVIGSNAFRVLFKPNFSGTAVATRKNIFGVGTLGALDSFYIYNSDDLRGPAFLMTSQGGGATWFANSMSNFNWSSSSWYYLGASFDQSGATFYVRPVGGTATVQNVSFGTPQSWGTTMGSGAWDVQVGRRAPIFSAPTEGADGLIDDVKVFSSERWTLAQFNADFIQVTAVPEPSALMLLGVGGLILWRQRRQNG